MCLVMERERGCSGKKSWWWVWSREQQHGDDVLRHGSRGHPCSSSNLEAAGKRVFQPDFIEIRTRPTSSKHHIMWPKPPIAVSCRQPLTASIETADSQELETLFSVCVHDITFLLYNVLLMRVIYDMARFPSLTMAFSIAASYP